MECPSCEDADMEETTITGGQLRYTCTNSNCGYSEIR